jgi:hypothetical protein
MALGVKLWSLISEKNEGDNKARASGRATVTLFLLLIVIIAGIAAHSSRQEWWEVYKHWIDSAGNCQCYSC